ncbi:hypothetical protein [Mycobacterium sp. 852002-10029_SCH5224772]|uniref:hypothetical protein n=1 Tax=Mycobacterium sp. 852002-10029_SCH5224772 TaxID=1834083 RepID=UPI0007FDA882|nr:hypothetical protein [Mycobacterium sp. 852002-10029_SCH5224772]OBF07654.1 hypothetical protein A5775_01090 [Mycobacterium sp. 852002-10029_SCH5224772]
MTDGGGAALLPYRVHAIASTTADLVEHAGGWLFDHVMAGWKVTVLLPDCADPRPMHVLGAAVGDLETVLTTAHDLAEMPAALVVAADLYGHDSRVRRFVRAACDDHRVRTLLWGQEPAGRKQGIRSVHYGLGAAARAFKAEALAASGVRKSTIEPAEVFRAAGGQRAHRRIDRVAAGLLSQG